MKPPRYAVVGTLSLDNIVAADGTYFVGKVGGNVLWAAVGARLWTDRLGVVARAGADYPQEPLTRLAEAGVDTGGVRRTADPHGLRIAYRHRADGGRDQPVPPEALEGLSPQDRARFVDTTRDPALREKTDPVFEDVPEAWLASVELWHLPLLPLRLHRAFHAGLSAHGGRIIADCPNRFEIGDLAADMAPTLPGLAAFLPSTSDLDVISPGADGALVATGLAVRGGRPVVLKRGPDGSLVVTADGRAWRVPAHPSAPVVDPTGAGDAFCGGFLVGLGETGDLLEAAARGAVSASFAVETADPLAALGLDPGPALERLARLRPRITKI